MTQTIELILAAKPLSLKKCLLGYPSAAAGHGFFMLSNGNKFPK